MQNIANDVSMYYIDTLYQNLPSEDYKEFSKLVDIFLGKILTKVIHFRRPRTYHLARWMYKGIYCFNINIV